MRSEHRHASTGPNSLPTNADALAAARSDSICMEGPKFQTANFENKNHTLGTFQATIQK